MGTATFEFTPNTAILTQFSNFDLAHSWSSGAFTGSDLPGQSVVGSGSASYPLPTGSALVFESALLIQVSGGAGYLVGLSSGTLNYSVASDALVASWYFPTGSFTTGGTAGGPTVRSATMLGGYTDGNVQIPMDVRFGVDTCNNVSISVSSYFISVQITLPGLASSAPQGGSAKGGTIATITLSDPDGTGEDLASLIGSVEFKAGNYANMGTFERIDNLTFKIEVPPAPNGPETVSIICNSEYANGVIAGINWTYFAPSKVLAVSFVNGRNIRFDNDSADYQAPHWVDPGSV